MDSVPPFRSACFTAPPDGSKGNRRSFHVGAPVSEGQFFLVCSVPCQGKNKNRLLGKMGAKWTTTHQNDIRSSEIRAF